MPPQFRGRHDRSPITTRSVVNGNHQKPQLRWWMAWELLEFFLLPDEDDKASGSYTSFETFKNSWRGYITLRIISGWYPPEKSDQVPKMMASTVTSTNNLSLRSILEKGKLTGSNFLDWERNLMIVLRHERKLYVLEEPLREAPPATAPAAARNAHKKHSDDLLDVACLMLATMSPDLQAGLINTHAYDMIRQLRDMFQTQARTERYDATKAFNEWKMVKGTSVSDHVMKMKRHLDHLERLGHPVPLQLATDTILNSLSEDYRPFVVNYNMNKMEKSIAELHSMLKIAELNMGNKNKTKDVLMVRDGGVKKKNGHTSTSKGKGSVQAVQSAPKKGKGKGKGKKVKPNKARTENRCFTCNEVGQWRQNCPKRHEAGGQE
ncbi:hypothetical protein OSB04_005297 [Centaurea solstitialis]|uniref:CCHC-type domain-containing protein n=1 Tax=Centaurea solstitialis TaxID=347529 RepID=A0AA38WGB3_9ASTR|nr:hypothetical protein OSB04_005297 [Centaurea solstitialis]